MPTLLMSGEREPLGDLPVARELTSLIPNARLQALPTGHVRWLGRPALTAAIVLDFIR